MARVLEPFNRTVRPFAQPPEGGAAADHSYEEAITILRSIHRDRPWALRSIVHLLRLFVSNPPTTRRSTGNRPSAGSAPNRQRLHDMLRSIRAVPRPSQELNGREPKS
jgi:hypothetical protein